MSVTIGSTMGRVTITQLSDVWAQSRDAPLSLFESEEPVVEAGSYVIEPGERVPEAGTTSHEGDELSVILSGRLDLVVDGERSTVGPETMTVIPGGTPHFSENTGDEPARLVYVVLGEL